jgi:hypothetical protein
MTTEAAEGRRTATAFYLKHFPDKLYEIDYIDFNRPVQVVSIPPGTHLIGYKDPRVSPFLTTFFTIPGSELETLGVHHTGALKTNPKPKPKVMNAYEVLVEVPEALESVCADGIDDWSIWKVAHPVKGGGWQYKIPKPSHYMRYTTPFPQR